MRIGIIGHFGGKTQCLDGQTIKTISFYNAFILQNIQINTIDVIDTYYIRHNWLIFIRQLLLCALKDKKIVVMLSANGRRAMFPLLYGFSKVLRKEIYHYAIGGRLACEIVQRPRWKRYVNAFEANWMESRELAQRLRDMGIANAQYMPNFKAIKPIEASALSTEAEEPYRFCMFSRVMMEKGVLDAIEAIKNVNRSMGKMAAVLDIYGPVDGDFKATFENALLEAGGMCRYCGVAKPEMSVQVLRDYYMLLFPTHYRHEGMPGTIIDALAAGIPVIARNWRYCREMLEDGKTGLIYDFEHPEQLPERIIFAIRNKPSVMKMKRCCVERAKAYTEEAVMDQITQAMGLRKRNKGEGNMGRMKIWEVIPTLGNGGAEQMVIDLVDGLKKRGLDVTLISLYDASFASPDRLKKLHDCRIDVCWMGKKSGFDPMLLRKMMQKLKRERPDIIHSHICAFPYVAALRLACGFKHIHTMHSIAGIEDGRIYRRLMKCMAQSEKTMFVTLNVATQRTLTSNYPVKASRNTCIPNGVDLEKFHPVYRENKDGLQILAVGSLIPVKNHSLLVSAFAGVEAVRGGIDKLIILGEGSLRTRLEQEIEVLGLSGKVILPGHVDNVKDYLNTSDVFVMPSRYEGVSLALLEAAASGLPIICAATGGTPEVVGEDAVLIDDGDLEGLKEKMLKMLSDREFREGYARRSRTIAQRHSLSRMIDEYEALYKREFTR